MKKILSLALENYDAVICILSVLMAIAVFAKIIKDFFL